MVAALNILVTDQSSKSIKGYNLDGGELVSFKIDPTAKPEISEKNITMWKAGDIALLDIDDSSQFAQVRAVIPDEEAFLLKLREFQIIGVDCTSGNIGGPYDGFDRHVYLKGKTQDGTEYIVPTLNASYLKWDLSTLNERLMNVQWGQYEGVTPKTRLSHEIGTSQFYGAGEELRPLKDMYNNIFYPARETHVGTFFDMASSISTDTLKVNQTDGATRAEMVVAVVPLKEGIPPLALFPKAQRAIAVSVPYFIIDRKKVFIRTSAEAKGEQATLGS